jgi:hypothetical protein
MNTKMNFETYLKASWMQICGQIGSLTILSVLIFQLSAGTALAQVAGAAKSLNIGDEYAKQASKAQIVTRSATEGYDIGEDPDWSADDRGVRSMVDANEYIQSFVNQTEWFERQCVVKKKDGAHIKWETAFILQEDIKYSNMNIRTCAQMHDKLFHMYGVAQNLVQKFGITDALQNKNCDDCSAGAPAAFLDQENPDFTPPGEKCSIGAQEAIKAEKCGLGDQVKGMGNLSCLASLGKGILLGLKDAIVGIGKLLGEGLKWAGQQIKKGWNKLMAWEPFKKAETKADQGIHQVSKTQDAEYQEFEKDKEGWLKRTTNKVLDFLGSFFKELTYRGMWEREAKCLNCKEKSALLCEIGGRVISDLVGFTMTAGFAYGAVKTAVGKFSSKLADITARLNTKLLKAAEANHRGAKAALATTKVANKAFQAGKKGIVWIGGLPIRLVGALSEKTMRLWKGFSGSVAKSALLNPRNPSGVVRTLQKTANVVALPAKIILAPVKMTTKMIGRYFDFDQRILANAAKAGARTAWASKEEALKIQQSLLPTLDKARVTLVPADARPPVLEPEIVNGVPTGKMIIQTHGDLVARLENGKRVWEVPPSYLTAERIAEFKRAKIEIPKMDANGLYRLETSNSAFKKLVRGNFATPKTRYGIPYDKNGIVVIQVGHTNREVKASKLSLREIRDLEERGAVFTTKDHPNWDQAINPNKIDPKWYSKKIENNPGTVVAKRGDDTFTYQARNLTPDQMKKMESEGYTFIEEGLDNQLAPTQFENGKLPGQEITSTPWYQNHQKYIKDGDTESLTAAQMAGIDELNVIVTKNVTEAERVQKELSRNYSKANPKTFEGIHESFDIGFSEINLPGNKSHIRVYNPVQDTYRTLPATPGIKSVDLYQGGNRAIVRTHDGGSVIYDLSRGENGVRITAINQSDSVKIHEAMGEFYRGKPMDQAALDDVVENIKSQGLKEGQQYSWVKASDGTTDSLRIKVDPKCGKKGYIDIPLAK